jgi:hypothetical protein
MSNKDFWLKLLSENDTALASVIILAERFVKSELSENEVLYINDKRKWLYEEAPKDKTDLFN